MATMDTDLRYECALAAALVILDQRELAPERPRHQVLAEAIFTILLAMEHWEEERGARRVEFSAN
jgi:hypothetical protein